MAASPVRAWCVWLHRWVGLTVGVLFTLTCVSGTALYFQPQFWEWAHGELTPEDLPAAPASLDRWVVNSRAAVPDLGRPIAMWPPFTEHNLSDAGMVIFGGRPPGGLGHTGFVAVLVAPSTGDVLGVVDVDRSPAYAPLFFHRNFWGGEIGSLVVGVMAIGSLVLMVVGLYLWWPAAAVLGRKLSGRPWRLTLTRSRPMHDWVGVWTLPILLVLTFTGLYIAQPSWIAPAIDALTEQPADSQAGAAACGAAITLDEAVARATALTGAPRFNSIYAGEKESAWEITLPGEGSDAAHRETHVVADLSCGTVGIEATPQTRASSEAATLWLYGLHDGTALGPLGPALVSIAGLGPLVLMISGVLMWARRRPSAIQRPSNATRRRTVRNAVPS